MGKKKKDQSFARLLITGKNQKHLDEILETVYRLGAVSKIQQQITLKKSPKNYVMPDNFYSTTNNHTQVFHKGKWIPVEDMMMDKCIVIKGNRAFCVPVRDVKKNDQIIVGEKGIKITPPERPREGVTFLNLWEIQALVKDQLNILQNR